MQSPVLFLLRWEQNNFQMYDFIVAKRLSIELFRKNKEFKAESNNEMKESLNNKTAGS